MDEVAAVDVGDGAARAEIEHMGAAAERIDARFRAGMAPAEAPYAGKVERFGAAKDEPDDVFRLALFVAAEPECTRSDFGLDCYREAGIATFLAMQLRDKLGALPFGALGIVRCPDIEMQENCV